LRTWFVLFFRHRELTVARGPAPHQHDTQTTDVVERSENQDQDQEEKESLTQRTPVRDHVENLVHCVPTRGKSSTATNYTRAAQIDIA
jgi:hypothetical protein